MTSPVSVRHTRTAASPTLVLAAARLLPLLLLVMILASTGCEGTPDLEGREYQAQDYAADAPRHPTAVHVPEGIGRAGAAACNSCHTEHASLPMVRTSAGLTRFHTEITLTHGDLSCTSCHAPEDRERLRLADARTIPFEEVMTLCGQCHGTQTRDWKHGAHGGMNGHWDLGRGPRERNNCIDCHAPHEPAFPELAPVFAPRDRFLPTSPSAH